MVRCRKVAYYRVMTLHAKAKHFLRRTKHLVTSRRFLIIMGSVVAAFVLINFVLLAIFAQRTYPATRVQGQKIGVVSFAELDQKLDNLQFIPENLPLKVGNNNVTVPSSDLGITTNTEQTISSVRTSRSWLPIYNLLNPPESTVVLSVNNAVFMKQMSTLNKKYATKPVDARIMQVKREFSIRKDSDGQEIDINAAQQYFTQPSDLASAIVLPLKTIPASVQAGSLESPLQSVKKQAATVVTVQYAGQQKTLDTATIFAQKGSVYEPSAAKVTEQIAVIGNGFGITVENLTEASATALAAIKSGQNATVTLKKQTAKRTFSYCVASKGVASSYLGGLRNKLKSTFADDRGWGLGGAVALTPVSSGCDFTVWLSAASQMPSFGAICDSMWSCRVGANVVINFDRWQNASPAWNAAGGSLDEYRAMVINHETGHWFGFYHRFCGGAGQPAPVMQQQSINLQGCKFNAWPTAAERADLKAQLGI